MKSENTPKIAVLLPFHNAQSYLLDSIHSILAQSYQNFELLLIDDGSTDNSWKIAHNLQDNRIKYYQNQQNKGLIFSLNKLLNEVSEEVKYIARMDADDVSMPQRLEKQVAFLEQRPNIVGCGCNVYYMNQKGEIMFNSKLPTEPTNILCYSLFTIPFCHPTIMIRKDFWLNPTNNLLYNFQYQHAEDYELFSRMLQKGDFCNIIEELHYYRLHNTSVSHVNSKIQIDNYKKVHANTLNLLNVSYIPQDLDLHYNLTRDYTIRQTQDVEQIHNWLIKLLQANSKANIYPQKELKDFIKHLWHKHSAGKTTLGICFGLLFANSPLSVYKEWTIWQKIKFWIKCLLRRA